MVDEVVYKVLINGVVIDEVVDELVNGVVHEVFS